MDNRGQLRRIIDLDVPTRQTHHVREMTHALRASMNLCDNGMIIKKNLWIVCFYLMLITTMLLCSCRQEMATNGPPPPPPVPPRPLRVAAFRLGGTEELDDIPVDSLKEGLKLFRFTEGTYYAMEAVDLGGDAGLLPARAGEAIRRGADLIVVTHPSLLRAVAAHSVGRPVVFGVLGDPLALGVGQDDEHHPAEVTGAYNPIHAYSVLALARYYLPRAKRVGVVFNVSEPLSLAHKEAMIRDSARVNLEVVAVGLQAGEEASDAIERLLDQPIDAVSLVVGLGRSSATIIERARRARVPVFGFREDHVRAGALAAEVPDVERVGVEAGRVIFHVLSGEKPGSLPYRRLIDTNTFVNPAVAEELAIALPPGALRNARAVGKTPGDPGE
jgi:putative ABC transport system substrate-binding protein